MLDMACKDSRLVDAAKAEEKNAEINLVVGLVSFGINAVYLLSLV
jgi:hypothetical protein